MGKTAFLYPGQGSQKVGMSSNLLQTAPELFQHYLTRSDTVTGVPVAQYSLEGPQELLNQTHVTQTALFTYSLALTEYAHRCGLYPDMVAGHSLGEYTAAVVAGALSFEEGLHLVAHRGKFMHQIQNTQPGAMAAIIGLPVEKLQELCQSISRQNLVTVTNWNAPTQFVVSGVEAGIHQLIELIREQTSGRAIRLAVKGAFHSPLMKPVQSALQEVMKDLTWHDAHIPLVANVSGKQIIKGHHIYQELIEQIASPVRWIACIETLIDAGCDTFIEIGSGQVLSKLVRIIAPGTQSFSLDTPAKVAAYAETQTVHIRAA